MSESFLLIPITTAAAIMSIAAARLPKMMIIDESSAGAAAGMSAWSMATVSDAGAAIGAAPSPMFECAAVKRAAPIAVLPAVAAGLATDDDAETIAAFAAASAAAGIASASVASAITTDSSAETSPSGMS